VNRAFKAAAIKPNLSMMMMMTMMMSLMIIIYSRNCQT